MHGCTSALATCNGAEGAAKCVQLGEAPKLGQAWRTGQYAHYKQQLGCTRTSRCPIFTLEEVDTQSWFDARKLGRCWSPSLLKGHRSSRNSASRSLAVKAAFRLLNRCGDFRTRNFSSCCERWLCVRSYFLRCVYIHNVSVVSFIGWLGSVRTEPVRSSASWTTTCSSFWQRFSLTTKTVACFIESQVIS